MAQQDFDWYISPSDRFSYETQFTKYSKDGDEVALHELDPLFQLSRLQTEEFLQIWQLVDIKSVQKLNKDQFIYFMHVLNTRRKGKPLPFGVPLDIKEKFMKEERKYDFYVRLNSSSIRDVGKSSNKDAKELQAEIDLISSELRSAEADKILEEGKLAELQITKEEYQGLVDYKRRQMSAFREEVSKLKDGFKQRQSAVPAISGGSNTTNIEAEELLRKLQLERQMLEARRNEMQRSIETVAQELARERL